MPRKNNAIKYDTASPKNEAFLDQLQEASLAQREEILAHYLKPEISKMLHRENEEILLDQHLLLLGLDSLILVRLMNSVSGEFKIKIVPHELVEAFPQLTINSLAKILAKNIPHKEAESIDIVDVLGGPIVPDPEHRHLPFDLTDIQYAYWFGQSGVLEWGNVPCHLFIEFDRKDEDLDLDCFNHAFQRVIERHEMLRAIVLADGKQRILRQVPPYEIEVLDMRGKAPDVVESSLNAIRQHMSVQKFQHDQWPLFKLRATRFNDNLVRFHFSLDLIIFDAQSIQIVYRDLAWFYNNSDGNLPPLELSFRDYINSWAVIKESNLYKKSRDYWIDRLPTLPPPPELPLVKNIALLSDTKFASQTFELDSETWSRLKNRASRAGLTASCLLLAAYTIVLTVWNKSSRFILNLTQFNRHPLHPQVMEILGDFTSALLISVDNSGQHSFEARARRIQEKLWEAMEHRYFSGVEVMREMAKRQDGKPFIVPYIFTSVTGIGANIGEEGQQEFEETVMGKNIFMASQTPQVILDHQIYERHGGLTCRWEVAQEVFPDGLIDDMFDAYCNYLKRLACEEKAWQETTFKLIPACQLEKRAKVNATDAPLSSEMLHTLFANQVFQQPDHLAVISSDRTLSYKELFNYSNHVGRLLREKGAEPNTLVAVVMEKAWEQVVATLGILNSGAAYLPIGPAIPRERLWHLLNDGKVSLVLTQSWLDERLEWPKDVQRFSVDKMELADKDANPLDPVQKPEDLAYVIYTSGSTGVPKGVMIDHCGAVNTILDVNKRFGVSPEDKVLALSNLNFDLSVYDIFGTLAAGGTIVLPEADKTKDPAYWLKLMEQEQVTVWNSVPALMQMLVEYASGRNEVVPQSPRLVLLSGDWIPLDLPDKIKTLVKDVQVISLGGSTEASIWSNLYPIEEVDPDWKSIPYGRPMVNQRFYVLNEFMEDCPDWVTGQLYIGGIGLAKGYWHDEEKTRTSFITHPRTGERLYRTGDLGRHLPDGNIEFLGREDFQVKISGHRIELGEIEITLKQHPGVRDAVVTAAGEPQGNKRLVGYVVPEKEQAPAINDLRSFLREKLPEYMVPSAFVMLDAFPLTPGGKVDRKELAQLSEVKHKQERTFVTPGTLTETTMAEIWAQVLNIDRVSVHDNFFQVGGNSLLATKLVFKIREAFKIELPLPRLFESPTVAELSQVIDSFRFSVPGGGMDVLSITDLNGEAVLDPAISSKGMPVEHIAEPAYIFLTGATGFLGSFLLRELLRQTQADIYCLVRSSSKEQAKNKLQRNLESYSLWNESLSSRVIPVVGDLSQPLFGLSAQSFQRLASQIDIIYHCGAWVHFIYSYSTLKPVNVLGTQEVLRLATQIKVKPVHYISTTSVFPSVGYSGSKIIREDDDLVLDHNGSLYGGYPQSKWVAEKIVRIASSRGLPICIYRPGSIAGDSRTGIANTDDYVCRTLKGCIQIGCLQKNIIMDVFNTLLPVDYVSRAIFYLSRQEELSGKTFHLVNPNPPHVSDIVSWIRSFGYPLKEASYSQWREKLINDSEILQQNALYPLLPIFPERISEEEMSSQIRYDMQNTLKGLANSDIVFPAVDDRLLNRYFSYFRSIGFLNSPCQDNFNRSNRRPDSKGELYQL